MGKFSTRRTSLIRCVWQLCLLLNISVWAQSNDLDQTYFVSSPTNFWNALVQSNRPLRVLWLGDSVGGDTLASMEAAIGALRPIAGGSFFLGFPRYMVNLSGSWSQPVSTAWYQAPFRMFAGATGVWHSNSADGLVLADTLSVHYLGDAADGSFRVEYSTNGLQWIVLDTINAAQSTGFTSRVYALTRGSYQARIVSLGGGASDKVDFLWLALTPNFFNFPQLMASTQGGIAISTIVDVGSNSFCTMLRSANPDLIVIEEKHDPPTYTNGQALLLATWLKAASPAADVVYVGSHITGNAAEPSLTQDQNLWFRNFGLTNGWNYVDGFSRLNNWQEIVAHQWNVDQVHLNAGGQKVIGDFLVEKLGLRPVIRQTKPGGPATVTLSGSSASGLKVTLQKRTSLGTNVAWQDGPTILATNGAFSLSTGAASSNIFFRVGISLP